MSKWFDIWNFVESIPCPPPKKWDQGEQKGIKKAKIKNNGCLDLVIDPCRVYFLLWAWLKIFKIEIFKLRQNIVWDTNKEW